MISSLCGIHLLEIRKEVDTPKLCYKIGTPFLYYDLFIVCLWRNKSGRTNVKVNLGAIYRWSKFPALINWMLNEHWSWYPPSLQVMSDIVVTEGPPARPGWHTLRAWPSLLTAPCTLLTAPTSVWWIPKASSTPWLVITATRPVGVPFPVLGVYQPTRLSCSGPRV